MSSEILLIDDDEDVRAIMKLALEDEGHKVSECENGKRALERLKTMPPKDFPSLIIVDYLMPEMDGVSFIKKIRQDFSSTIGKIPLALSTADSTQEKSNLPEDILFLNKPMDLNDLLKLVHSHMH